MPRRTPPAIPDPAVEGDEVAILLDRLRKELVDLHAATVDLQLCLGPTLAAAAGDGAVLRAGQTLDLLTQSLDGLATFAGAASRHVSSSGRLDAAAAAATVTLDALSSRLAGRAPSRSPRCRPGDLDLF